MILIFLMIIINSKRLGSTVLSIVQREETAFEEVRLMMMKKKNIIPHCESSWKTENSGVLPG